MSTIINATTTNGVVIQPDNSGSLQLQTNSGTTAVTIDTSQNVGIGTTSPTSKLDVSGSGNTRIFATSTGTTGTFPGFVTRAGTQGNLEVVQNSGNGEAYIYNVANAAMTFATNNTERMRIDSSGRVLINATSSFGGRLQSTGIAASSAAASFRPGQNGDGTAEWFNASGGYVGAVTVNASTVVYGGTSDYRLKDNIVPMTNALDKVSKLKPVTYTWKSTGENGEGFIAHELQEIIPSAVVGEKDAVNKDGSIKPQEIDTSFLVATLTAAIQEQQTIINDLTARITALEGAA
jgi:hypothetical protein